MANSILELPVELVLEAFDCLTDVDDWKSVACVTPSFYVLAINRIWARADRQHRHRIFMWACASGSLRAVRRLLDLGFTTNLNFQLRDDTNLKDLTPEFYLRLPPNPSLAQTGWIDSYACTPYMDDYYDPAAPFSSRNNAQFWKPLHVAAHYGQNQIIDILLQNGAWVDATSMNYCKCTRPVFPYGAPKDLGRFTPLHVALCKGHEGTARVLISHGATMYVDHHIYRPYRTYGPNRGRITALHLCASYGLLSTAKFLVEGGYCETGIDQLDEFGFSPLMYAFYFRRNNVFDYLLAQGASLRVTRTSVPSTFDSNARSILHQACHDQRWGTVAKLVNHGSDPLELDRNDDPPMILCIKSYIESMICRYNVGPTGLDDMVIAIKTCGMPTLIPQAKLAAVAKYALRGALTPLVSLLLDCGLDISTTIPSCGKDKWLHKWKYEGVRGAPTMFSKRAGYWIDRWDCEQAKNPEAESQPGTTDPDSYYSDTGNAETQQTLLDFACFHTSQCPELPDVIQLLLDRGCINPGDIQGYVRAIKNICINDRYELDYDKDQNYLHHCLQILYSHLSTTIENDAKPHLPADLLYVCLEKRQRLILDELLTVFDLPSSFYSEEDLRGNPFRGSGGNSGIHFPFAEYLIGTDENFKFYQKLCQHAINDETDGADLFDVTQLACIRGKYIGIQELRLNARGPVDAIIRDNAVPFLQKLLANLYVFDDAVEKEYDNDAVFYGGYTSIEEIDEVIDTIRLLLELGPSDILESGWSLETPRIEGLTAMSLLERLLAQPDNPHTDEENRTHCDKLAVRYRYRIAWCLNERIKTKSFHGRITVAVLGGEIAWPEHWYEHWARPECPWGETKRGFLEEIPMPWERCRCDIMENIRVRPHWYWP
ncbi:hypothetical protein PG993_004294 [Apiospora rasikravindrae]|uniref:Ankyrin n=1 Tax=Apiospora rasikravindrae TaxID=990691 RepID=A0ABR1TEB3_9PEZI